MWLEDFVPQEWAEWWWNSQEVVEKMKEAAKKAASWIKKVQKDEKKAKKHDDLLAKYLVLFIKDKKYDFILNDLLLCLNTFYPSNFLIWILSLIEISISDEIRWILQKEKINFSYKINESLIDFDDNNIDKDIQTRINSWMEDIISILLYDYSEIQMSTLIENYNDKNYEKDKIFLHNLASKMFIFFFSNLNIKISKNKANSYTSFILSEVYNNIKNLKTDNINEF